MIIRKYQIGSVQQHVECKIARDKFLCYETSVLDFLQRASFLLFIITVVSDLTLDLYVVPGTGTWCLASYLVLCITISCRYYNQLRRVRVQIKHGSKLRLIYLGLVRIQDRSLLE